ncbi:MAG: ComEC/Rec2 family competence protein [bacterium]|nr:ComEC/Rec2 family competence protein [bacterium]
MKKNRKTLSILTGMLLVLLLFTGARLSGPVNKIRPLLKVVILDVWQGDASLIIFPNKKTLLIDAGPGGSEYTKFDAGKSVVSPYLRKNRISFIDTIVWTHPHSDHIGGIPSVLDKARAGEVLDCGMAYTTELYINCLTVVDREKIKYTIPRANDRIKLDPLVQVKVVHPSKNWEYSNNPNDNSIVIKVKYGKVSFLFTGDAENEAEDFMVREGQDIKATILKVPHHGSDTSSSDDFLDTVDPEAAVISVGRNNKFGHPAKSTIAKYQERGIKIYRTDQNGDLTFTTDGEHYTVDTAKKEF